MGRPALGRAVPVKDGGSGMTTTDLRVRAAALAAEAPPIPVPAQQTVIALMGGHLTQVHAARGRRRDKNKAA